jgi:hypothetical protein
MALKPAKLRPNDTSSRQKFEFGSCEMTKAGASLRAGTLLYDTPTSFGSLFHGRPVQAD